MGFDLSAETTMALEQSRLDEKSGHRDNQVRKVVTLPIGEVRALRLAFLRHRGDAMPKYQPDAVTLRRPRPRGGDDAA